MKDPSDILSEKQSHILSSEKILNKSSLNSADSAAQNTASSAQIMATESGKNIGAIAGSLGATGGAAATVGGCVIFRKCCGASSAVDDDFAEHISSEQLSVSGGGRESILVEQERIAEPSGASERQVTPENEVEEEVPSPDENAEESRLENQLEDEGTQTSFETTSQQTQAGPEVMEDAQTSTETELASVATEGKNLVQKTTQTEPESSCKDATTQTLKNEELLLESAQIVGELSVVRIEGLEQRTTTVDEVSLAIKRPENVSALQLHASENTIDIEVPLVDEDIFHEQFCIGRAICETGEKRFYFSNGSFYGYIKSMQEQKNLPVEINSLFLIL